MRYAWLLLIPLGILTFHNLYPAGLVGDDYDQVAANTLIQSLDHPWKFLSGSTFYSGGGELRGTYYKPAMTAVFALVYNLVGSEPFHFHMVQIVLGILNSILLYFFFLTLFAPWVALLGAALFLVHPVNSEVVQYISNYQDVLFMTFGLAALNVEAYLRLAARSKLAAWGWCCLEIVLLLLAALSKETGVLFIPLFGIYHRFRIGSSLRHAGKFSGLDWPAWFTLLATSGVYAALRIFVSRINEIHSHYAPMETADFGTRLLNVPAVVFYYIKNFFIPWPLSLAQHWIYREFSFQGFILPLLGVAAAIWFMVLTVKRFGSKAWLFAIWVVISIGLHSQLIPLDATVADRWHYLPSVAMLGFILLWMDSVWSAELQKGDGRFSAYPRVVVVVPLIFLVGFTWRTYERNEDWADEESLLRRDLIYQPDSFAILSQLGFILNRSNRADEACELFKRSVELAPMWWINTNNLGVCFYHRGDMEQAKKYFKISAEVGSYHLAYENYAKALIQEKRFAEAREFIKWALQTFPNNPSLAELANSIRDVSN